MALPRALGVSREPCRFVDLEHGIGYSYLMKKSHVAMAQADLLGIGLGDEVYDALDAGANGSALPGADPWRS